MGDNHGEQRVQANQCCRGGCVAVLNANLECQHADGNSHDAYQKQPEPITFCNLNVVLPDFRNAERRQHQTADKETEKRELNGIKCASGNLQGNLHCPEKKRRQDDVSNYFFHDEPSFCTITINFFKLFFPIVYITLIVLRPQ